MRKNRFFLIAILVLIFTSILLYGKTAGYDFVNYDDLSYVINNKMIKNPTVNNIKKMFTEHYFANYQPLVHLSYAVEHKLYKLNASGYHITNIILHTINSILVLLLIYTMTKSSWISLFIALLFSLHPMQVESVAWISERKGLMCAFFYLLSFMAYIRFSRKKKIPFYFLSIILFLFSLLSKPMSITFPVILVLFDYYEDKLTRAKVIEKAPFFIMAALFSVIMLFAQGRGGSMTYEKTTNFFVNFIFANYNIGFYISKLIAPFKLSVHYEYPLTIYYLSKEFIVSVIVILCIIAYLVNFKKIKREVNFGILFFLISLFPILRFIPIGDTLIADRYVYIPIIGFSFAITSLFSSLSVDKKTLKKVLIVLVSGYFLFLGSLTYARCEVWKDGHALWANLLEDYPDSLYAVLGLGGFYMTRKDFNNARKHYFSALKYKPSRKKALYNIGLSYVNENDIENAWKYLTMLIDEFPDNRFADVYMHLGNICDVTGAFDDAVKFYNKSLSLNPGSSLTHYNYAMTLENYGKIEKAIEHYKIANKLDGNWGLPKKALGRLLR
jgi:tetratricopeptide (TPR) repeat protein